MDQIEINGEIAYKYIKNNNYYITKTGILYSTFVKGGHGKVNINNPRKVAYGKDKDGYLRVVLSNKGCKKYVKIHQIVADQFIGSRPCNYVVNHIDGNKSNNSIDNLEIITSFQNTQHAWRNGLNRKELNPNRVAVDIYDNVSKKVCHFKSISDASRTIDDVSSVYINHIRKHEVNFNLCFFKKIATGAGLTDYFVECYYNGMLFKTFINNKEAGLYFKKMPHTVSGAYRASYPKRVNRYTITFPNVSTIESIT